jgi:putative FmdB family regulatory protein
MPTYEFRCDKCKKDFDVDCSIKYRNEDKMCPFCTNIDNNKRIFATGGVIYSDDDFRNITKKSNPPSSVPES